MGDQVKLEIVVDDKGSLVIKNFKDVVGKSMGEVSGQSAAAGSSVAKLWKDMAIGSLVADGIRSTYSAFVGVLKSSVEEYLKAEEGNAALRQTLANLGDTTDATFNSLDKYAAQIQATTVIDDDMAKSLMQLGLNMGIPIKQIGGATEAAIGLTRAFKGMSLDSAMKATAAAFEGNTQKLQRYIPELKETATVSEKLAIVQKAMSDGLKIAHNEITTGAGKLKQFRNDWDDIKEAIGKVLIEAILPMLNGLRNWFNTHKAEIIATVESWGKAFADFVMTVGSAMRSVIGFLVEYKDVIIVAGIAMGTYFAGAKIIAMAQGFAALATAIASGALAFAPLVAVVGAAAAAFLLLKNHMDKFKDVDKEMAASAANTTAFVERQAALEKLGVSYKDLDDALKEFKTSSNSSNDALNLAMESAKKGDPYLVKLAGAFSLLETEEKKAAVAGKEITKVHTDLIPKIKDTAAATEALKIKNWELDQSTKTYKESLPGLNQLLANLKTSEFEVAAIFKLSTVATDDNTFSLNQNEKAQFDLSGASWHAVAATKETTDKTKEASAATQKWTIDWKDANEVMQFAESIMGEVRSALSSMGIELGAQGEAWMQAAEGVMLFIQGALSGNPLQMIAAGLKLVASGMASVTIVQKGLYYVNDALNKQLNDLGKTMKDYHAAESVMFGSLIANADLSLLGFDRWANRTREILTDFDRGVLTSAQTTKAIGDAFDALISKAKELGTEGSASLIAMFEDLANRGMRVKEVMEYVDAQMAVGLEGYKKMKAATLENADALAAFGGVGIKVFDDMIAYEEKIAANRGLVDGIEGATAAMIGLSNSQKLTEDQFDQFAASGEIAYQKLLDGGMTSTEALKTMGPYLQRLQFLHEQYGYTIDETTQKMMDQAIADGVIVENKKSDSQKMIDLLGSIAKVLGADIPDALGVTAKAATDAFDTAAKAAGKLSDSIDHAVRDRVVDININDVRSGSWGTYGGGGDDWVHAASGWQGWVAGGSHKRFETGEEEPEYVSITPLSKMRGTFNGPRVGSDSNGTQMDNRESRQAIIIEDHSVWHIQVDPKSGIDQNALCEGISVVVQNNRHQVADKIAAVVARKL